MRKSRRAALSFVVERYGAPHVVQSHRSSGESLEIAHVQMQQELATLLRRPIDLISKRALEQSSNWVRREAILNTAQVIVSVDEIGHAPQ